MIIAFDFHGVLESYPDKLKMMLMTLKKDHTVIVLSGPPLEEIHDELEKSGYVKEAHYNYAVSVVDWIKEQGVKMQLNTNGSWYCSDPVWWSSKAKICKELSVDMLFDDKLEYKEFIEDDDTLFLHVK